MIEMLKLRDSVFMINDDIWKNIVELHIIEKAGLLG